MTESTQASQSDDRKPNDVSLLLQLAAAGELFKTQNNTPYIRIQNKKHHEHLNLETHEGREWLQVVFFRAHRRTPSKHALESAIGNLIARSREEGPQIPVYVRVAPYKGRIIVDLCNAEWQAVDIGPTGWMVVNDPPVRFCRYPGMQPLPPPARGAGIDAFRPFVNVREEDGWLAIVGWMIGALHPFGPYQILEICGAQGSAKSTVSRMIRSLIDPHTPPLTTASRTEQELFIAAQSNWICAFDNLSYINDVMSDSFCKIATGGANAARTLFTNTGQTVLEARRPLMLNGINELASRPDLMERTLSVELAPISDDNRRDEQTLWEEFEGVRPEIVGTLFDAVSHALRNLDSTRLSRSPRMADVARFATAAEGSFGWEKETILNATYRVRESAEDRVFESDPVAAGIEALLQNYETWDGTATELLSELGQMELRGLPKSAKELGHALMRVETVLKSRGYRVERERKEKARILHLSRSA